MPAVVTAQLEMLLGGVTALLETLLLQMLLGGVTVPLEMLLGGVTALLETLLLQMLLGGVTVPLEMLLGGVTVPLEMLLGGVTALLETLLLQMILWGVTALSETLHGKRLRCGKSTSVKAVHLPVTCTEHLGMGILKQRIRSLILRTQPTQDSCGSWSGTGNFGPLRSGITFWMLKSRGNGLTVSSSRFWRWVGASTGVNGFDPSPAVWLIAEASISAI
jgi:hypothetical protein